MGPRLLAASMIEIPWVISSSGPRSKGVVSANTPAAPAKAPASAFGSSRSATARAAPSPTNR